MYEAAWARRGHLVRLRKRLRQARDAELDAAEAADAAGVELNGGAGDVAGGGGSSSGAAGPAFDC
jgi:hypothetical protein